MKYLIVIGFHLLCLQIETFSLYVLQVRETNWKKIIQRKCSLVMVILCYYLLDTNTRNAFVIRQLKTHPIYHIFISFIIFLEEKIDELPVGQDLEQEEKSSMFKPI